MQVNVMNNPKGIHDPLSLPIVMDYQPYTRQQLSQYPRIVEVLSPTIHKNSWDLYYRNNTINGFKDRNYIFSEFVELREAILGANSINSMEYVEDVSEQKGVGRSLGNYQNSNLKSFCWLEAGCGVGNAILPIFKQFGHLPHWRLLLGFDISKVAIQLLNEKKRALPAPLQEKLNVFVLNPCEEAIVGCNFSHFSADNRSFSSPASSNCIEKCSVDFASMIFVLSSIPLALHTTVLKRVAECMVCPGGVFFFRDYANFDLAESRFRDRDKAFPAAKHKNGLGTEPEKDKKFNSFARTNGTLTHFFSKDELVELFRSVGFRVIELKEINTEAKVHTQTSRLSRRFLQGRFFLEKMNP